MLTVQTLRVYHYLIMLIEAAWLISRQRNYDLSRDNRICNKLKPGCKTDYFVFYGITKSKNECNRPKCIRKIPSGVQSI